MCVFVHAYIYVRACICVCMRVYKEGCSISVGGGWWGRKAVESKVSNYGATHITHRHVCTLHNLDSGTGVAGATAGPLDVISSTITW